MTDAERTLLKYIIKRDGGVLQNHSVACQDLGLSDREYGRAVRNATDRGWLAKNGAVTEAGREALRTQ